VVLRLLTLKHIRNWSYEELEREVRANLVYRDFTHVGGAKMPDAKTMGRWGLALGPQVLKQIHRRIVKIAQAKGVTAGRRMRVDTTVVETNIHHPTDSTLLGDGVRVLTAEWQGEYERWHKRNLSARRYVYVWADGVIRKRYELPRRQSAYDRVLKRIGIQY
jgi:hypothetical protein